MAILSPSPTPEPVDHDQYDPACDGCGFLGSGACSTVCGACGCVWTTDASGDPNYREESCDREECACHTIAFADTRAIESAEDGMEAAWKAAGYTDSFAVYQQEGR